MGARSKIIPLFPLERVLFPRMALPLHIFEDRYKLLISECLARNGIFGILHSQDAQQPAIGTTARVQRVLHTYVDGRMDIVVTGEDRFHVRRLISDKPYLEAEVEYFDDNAHLYPPRERFDEMIDLYRQYIRRLGLEEEQRSRLEELMDELDEEPDVSYIIGQTIGLDPRGQRELLEKTSPVARVDHLVHVLRRHDQVHHLAQHLFEGSNEFDPSQN